MATAKLPTLTELGGCVFGKPSKGSYGYISTMWRGKAFKLHRKVYIQHFGEIPEGMVIDHICHNVAIANGMCLSTSKSICIHRSCINPQHLQAITTGENQIAGLNGFGSRTHCKKGHELTPENIGVSKTQNYCKTCWRENVKIAQRRYRAKKKEVI